MRRKTLKFPVFGMVGGFFQPRQSFAAESTSDARFSVKVARIDMPLNAHRKPVERFCHFYEPGYLFGCGVEFLP